jgi:uncharacterized membrane protein YidH (DUF202 family)
MLSFLVAISLLLLPCYALTEYVSDNTVVVVQSVTPCHLNGDPDLYGLGIRLGFYLTWAILILAVGLGITDEAMAPRNNVIILFSAIFVVLIRNAYQGSFALFEWWIIDVIRVGLILPVLITLFTHISKIPAPENTTQVTPIENIYHIIYPETVLEKVTKPFSKVFRLRIPPANSPVHEDYKIFYADAIGFGYLYVLTGVFGVCQPWLYFKMSNSGHKQGCVIRVVFFGPIDLYNTHWQGFLKAWGIFWTALGVCMIIFGGYLLFSGLGRWTEREKAMEVLKSERDLRWRRLEELQETLADEGYDIDAFMRYGRPTDDSQRTVYGPLREPMAELWERTRNEDPTQAFDEFCRIFVPEFPFLEYGQFKANERDSRRTRGIAVAIYLLVGGAAIAFIEVTIRAFSDVSLQDSIANTTGQLLSLLLALFGILAFSYDIFRNRRKKTKKRKTISAIADRVFAMIVENNEEMERRQAEEQQAGFAQGPQSGEYLV